MFRRTLPHTEPVRGRSRDVLHNPRESVVVRAGMGRKGRSGSQ